MGPRTDLDTVEKKKKNPAPSRELNSRIPIIQVRIPGGGWEFFSSISCPERPWGPTEPPIQLIPGALSLVGREAYHSSPSSAEVEE